MLATGGGGFGDLRNQRFDVGRFPLDEAEQANILLFLQQLVQQTIAIVEQFRPGDRPRKRIEVGATGSQSADQRLKTLS